MGNLKERMKSPRRELSVGHIAGAAPLPQELGRFPQILPGGNPRMILRNSAESLQDLFLAVSTPPAGAWRGRSRCLAAPPISRSFCGGLRARRLLAHPPHGSLCTPLSAPSRARRSLRLQTVGLCPAAGSAPRRSTLRRILS